MLIQQVVRALRAPFVQNAFGFGSAKPRPVGFGLFRRLISFSALSKSLQVDHVPHACPVIQQMEAMRHLHEGVSGRAGPARSSFRNIPVKNIPVIASDSIKKYIPLCEKEIR
jgi:hypothetical protein